MSKLALVVGDAVVASGFAKMNHAYVDGLRAEGWDVAMLGINYHGDPHKYDFPIYPCRSIYGGDMMGMQRTAELTRRLRPDVVCVTQDPWNMPPYIKAVGNTPLVASIAVDGRNCLGTRLNGCSSVVFWTEFGRQEAKEGGYQGRSAVIPLGVDLVQFFPMDKAEAMVKVGMPSVPAKAFIVGVVGRNQPRKRLDLSMIYFADWVKKFGHDDAYLFLHVAPTGDRGYDLQQLAEYLKISNRVIYSEPPIEHGSSVEGLRTIYSTFDVMLSTTQGEGWGLCQMEAMACGVPVVAPDWSALGEWAKPAAYLVPCSSVSCTSSGINAVGGIMDQREAVKTLEMFYCQARLRERHRALGLELTAQDRFRWSDVGAQFAQVVGLSLSRKVLPMQQPELVAQADEEAH